MQGCERRKERAMASSELQRTGWRSRVGVVGVMVVMVGGVAACGGSGSSSGGKSGAGSGSPPASNSGDYRSAEVDVTVAECAWHDHTLRADLQVTNKSSQLNHYDIVVYWQLHGEEMAQSYANVSVEPGQSKGTNTEQKFSTVRKDATCKVAEVQS